MLDIYKTDGRVLTQLQEFEDGIWIRMINPDEDELNEVASLYNIEVADLSSALDDEESARISLEDDYTLILIDLPSPEIRHNKTMYTTIPLGILVLPNAVITVCRQKTPILNDFMHGRVRDFSTKKRMKFVYQICQRAAMLYQTTLRRIERHRLEIEGRAGRRTEDADLVDLHELESTLVYFSTSLNANNVVIERLRRYKRLEQYDEDMELLEDVQVETQQAMDMAAIYRNIIDSTRALLSSILDTRLNNTMKRLTSITMVMAIPTIISGIYGMNVNTKWMPFANFPHGFSIVCGLIVLICVIIMLILKKQKML